MELYDNAAYRFYQRLDLKGLPLLSWDIYGVYFDVLCKNHEDVVSLNRLSDENNWISKPKFSEALLKKGQVILITDSNLTIVHASHNLTQMNGYMPSDVVGKMPKLFQGKETCKKTTNRIGKAVRKRVPFEAVVINYRKDGSKYNCWLRGEPIFDRQGELVNFIAFEKEVA